MFKLKNKNLYISRTESGKVVVAKKDNSKISELDIKELRIYNKDALDEAPIVIIQGQYLDSEYKTTILSLILISYQYSTGSLEYSIVFASRFVNSPKSKYIVVGYDDSKAKSLFLYPAGIDKK